MFSRKAQKIHCSRERANKRLGKRVRLGNRDQRLLVLEKKKLKRGVIESGGASLRADNQCQSGK